MEPVKDLPDGEWTEVLSSPAESKSWNPLPKEGSELLVQIEQGKFAKYIYEDGRYNLVGTVE